MSGSTGVSRSSSPMAWARCGAPMCSQRSSSSASPEAVRGGHRAADRVDCATFPAASFLCPSSWWARKWPQRHPTNRRCKPIRTPKPSSKSRTTSTGWLNSTPNSRSKSTKSSLAKERRVSGIAASTLSKADRAVSDQSGFVLTVAGWSVFSPRERMRNGGGVERAKRGRRRGQVGAQNSPHRTGGRPLHREERSPSPARRCAEEYPDRTTVTVETIPTSL